MYTDKVAIVMQCTNPKCQATRSAVYRAAMLDVTQFAKILAKNRMRCYRCQASAKIKNIQCRVMRRKFGDINCGLWRCAVHPYKIYYPIPLKKAYLGRSGANTKKSDEYDHIAANGFPWRCPVCNRRMMYEEEDPINAFVVG